MSKRILSAAIIIAGAAILVPVVGSRSTGREGGSALAAQEIDKGNGFAFDGAWEGNMTLASGPVRTLITFNHEGGLVETDDGGLLSGAAAQLIRTGDHEVAITIVKLMSSNGQSSGTVKIQANAKRDRVDLFGASVKRHAFDAQGNPLPALSVTGTLQVRRIVAGRSH